MSAEISTARVQECVRAALADEVAAIGGIAAAHQECGVSEDSIRRRIAGTHAWSDKDLSAMVAAAFARNGRSLVVDRLRLLLESGPARIGDQRRACDDIMAALPALLSEAQAMSASIADRRLDRDEARSLLGHIPDIRKHLDQIEADCLAVVRS